MDELIDQTKALISFQDVKVQVYPYQIAFNLLPQIGSFGEGATVLKRSRSSARPEKSWTCPP